MLGRVCRCRETVARGEGPGMSLQQKPSCVSDVAHKVKAALTQASAHGRSKLHLDFRLLQGLSLGGPQTCRQKVSLPVTHHQPHVAETPPSLHFPQAEPSRPLGARPLSDVSWASSVEDGGPLPDAARAPEPVPLDRASLPRKRGALVCILTSFTASDTYLLQSGHSRSRQHCSLC